MPNTLVVIEKTKIPFVLGSKLGKDPFFFFFWSESKEGKRKVWISVGPFYMSVLKYLWYAKVCLVLDQMWFEALFSIMMNEGKKHSGFTALCFVL